MGGDRDVAGGARYTTEVGGQLYEERELKGELGFSGSARRDALNLARQSIWQRYIPLADYFPDHCGLDPSAEDGVEFGITCREGIIGVRQECLEWARRLSAFPADDVDDVGYLERR